MTRSHFDIAFAGVTVLIATGLFRFIAVPFGVPIYLVSGVLLVFILSYVMMRVRAFRFKQKQILPWVILLFVWPLCSILYSIGGDLRAALVSLNTFLIFAGISILIRRGQISIVQRVLSASLVLTYIGAILNLIRPNLFTEVARLADAYVLTMGRPGGFYLQPNDLAINIVLLFAGKLALDRGDRPVPNAITAGVVSLVVLLTGSRAGLVTLCVVLMFDVFGRLVGGASQVRMTKSVLTYVASLTLMGVGVFFTAKLALGFLKSVSRFTPGGLVDRLDAFLSLKLSYDGAGIQTQSVRDRWDAQSTYLELITEMPILGHGIGSEQLYLNTGRIPLSSHSSFLSMAFEYGIPYAALFTIALVSWIFPFRRSFNSIWLRRSKIWSFAILSLLLLFYSGNLTGRVPFVVLVAMAVTGIARSSGQTALQSHMSRQVGSKQKPQVLNAGLSR